jgi:hypothetical protein
MAGWDCADPGGQRVHREGGDRISIPGARNFDLDLFGITCRQTTPADPADAGARSRRFAGRSCRAGPRPVSLTDSILRDDCKISGKADPSMAWNV